MDANKADRVQSFSKSAKGTLSPIPYDPILYGDDTANELNEHEKGFEISKENDDKTLVEDEIDLGCNGNFNAVAKSYPFEMIVETKVCGPAYNRLSKTKDSDSSVVQRNNFGINLKGKAQKSDTKNTNEGYTRDEIAFISALEEKPIEHVEEKMEALSSKSVFKNIGPRAHQGHHLSTTDDIHRHLTVRKQLNGRLVYTADSNFKAKHICKNNCSCEFQKNVNDASLNSAMTLYRDQTLERYQSYFEKICAASEKSNGFTGRIKHELRLRRTVFDSIVRGARKQLTRLSLNAKNASTKVEQLLEEEKIMEMTSLLFEAVDTKEVDMVKTCLLEGALVDTKRSEKHGRTPFQTMFVRLCRMDEGLEPCSKMRECEEIIDVLFSHGCNIDEIDDAKSCNGWAPIHYASRYGKLKRVQWINSRGGNLDSRTASEQSPLMLACQGCRFEVVYYLIRNNANFRDKDDRDRTVLHYAALAGNKHLLEFLVQCGAANDKLEQSDDGESPLSICKQVCSECYEYLQKATLPKQSMSLQINHVTKEENKSLMKRHL